jgi:hypothetical protein
MSPTQLKMQPTIHLQNQREHLFFDFKNIKHSFVNFDINIIRLGIMSILSSFEYILNVF